MTQGTQPENLPPGFDQKTGPAAFAPPPTAETEPGESPDAGLQKRVAELEAENAALKDQALRALAEAENTRRRAERDREDASKYGISNFARGLLTAADNLRRAITAIPQELRDSDARITALTTGIEATERELLAAFDRVGIKKIASLDAPFNPNLHEVIFEAPGTGKPAGTIIQVVEEGYTIHDRLLRPARVGVAKADAGDAPPVHNLDQKV